MKLKYILYSLVGILFITTSCHGDLDIEQDNKLSASNMWKDATDVITYADGIYSKIRSSFITDNTCIFYWGEARIGDFMWGASLINGSQDATMLAVGNNTMVSTTASCSWADLYKAIDQANAVLKYAPKVTMKDAERSYAIGQAAFARAYCYFWAVRMWGDVPLVTVPIESNSQPEAYPTRTPKEQVYTQIGEDIKTALDNSANLGGEKYFATKDAVNMLKAEYGLWMYSTQGGDTKYLTLAHEALDDIGIYSSRLLSDFASVFSRTNKCNNEVIFALNNNQAEKLTGGFYWWFCHLDSNVAKEYRQKPVPIYNLQWWSYQQPYIDMLRKSKQENGDIRVDCNMGDGNYGANGGNLTWPNKYRGDMSGSKVILDSDIIYYRYAQAVMMDAELEYYQKNYSGALASLNILAKRAYGIDNFYKDASRDAVLQAITNEYLLEFPCEGVIWWALIRLDKIWEYNPSLIEKKKYNPNILLWPISASARNKNHNLEQTEGWS